MPDPIPPEIPIEVRGRAAYLEFHRQRNRLSPKAVPSWSELSAEHRLAWIAAARAAVKVTVTGGPDA